MTTQTMSDGSVVEYAADGTLLKETSPDGSVYSHFDAQGRAHHVRIPASAGGAATSADIAYTGDHTIYTYADKTVITYDAANHIISERLADGTEYTRFDADGRAHHVTIPAENGNPATSADISYSGSDSVYRYSDGSAVTFNSDGHIVDQKLADGSHYSQFDADNRAHHVDAPATNGNPATSADISYADGNSTYRYSDDSTVTYNTDGNVTDQKTPDGSHYTRFDTDGKAHHVDTPAHDGNPATSADITYQGSNAVYSYADGSTVTYGKDGNVIEQKTPDGSDYTQFDGGGKAHHVDSPAHDDNPATSAAIAYQGPNAVYSYTDGSTVTYDGNSNVIEQKTSDGSDYTQFDSSGKAHHVDSPAHDGNPATSADITYNNDDTTYTYADKTTVTYGPDGKTILDEKTPDGSHYTQFDTSGKAHHVDTPAHDGNPATSADISYDNEYTTYRLTDKTVLKYQSSNNALVSETLPDGSTYTQFDGNSKPHHVDVPPFQGKPATAADISYSDGKVIYTYPDRTVITYDEASTALLTQTSPEGLVYSRFDDDQRPGHVEIPAQNGNPATSADITYENGNTVYTYADRSIITYGPDGKTLLTEKMADGTVYSDFNANNKPGRVEIPAQNGKPATSAAITYENGNTVYTYPDKTAITYGPDGKSILTESMPDGTVYSAFDANNKPGHVEIPPQNGKPATSAAITYENGNTVYTYPDKTAITYGPDGKTVITERMPDGTVYSLFNGDNRPQHVVIPPQNGKAATSADITYDGGQATYRYPDGTMVTFDSASGDVVKQVMPSGWTILYTGGKPSSGSNSGTGQTIAITPDGNGGTIWTYSDGGPVIWQDANGKPYKEEANGWTFTTFNPDGLPTDGFMKTADGTIQTVHIDYDVDAAGDTKWIYTHNGQTTTVITNPDGVPLSQTNPDGASFTYAVGMAELLDAIGKVSNQRDAINSGLKAIGRQFQAIHEDWWTGPGSDHFYGHIEDFMSISQNVAIVLSEAIQRMESSYNNYVEVEKSVLTTLTPVTVESTPTFGSTGTVTPGNRVLGLNLGPGPVVNQPPGSTS